MIAQVITENDIYLWVVDEVINGEGFVIDLNGEAGNEEINWDKTYTLFARDFAYVLI